MKLQVYVIEDAGIEEYSLPLYAPTNVGAKRQFVAQLRILPPSARGDYNLVHIGQYDTDLCYHTPSDRMCILNGADETVLESIEEDKNFYNPRIDNLETKNAEVIK